MIFNTYISSENDLKLVLCAPGLKEVLIAPEELSKDGKTPLAYAEALASAALDAGLKTVLVWDLVMTESEFKESLSKLASLKLKAFDAIRVSDLGAARYVCDNFSQVALQLAPDSADHNYDTLYSYSRAFADRLERLSLSIELPEDKLCEYIKRLPLDCEILAAGPLKIFYTPRPLLHAGSRRQIKATASAADMSNRPLPVIQTAHGTHLYLDRDYFILHKLAKLTEAGLYAARIDLRPYSPARHSAHGIDRLLNAYHNNSDLRTLWPSKTGSPFFKTNKTTAQFKRLKPRILETRDQRCLATVLEYNKDKHTVITALKDFNLSDARIAIHPDGRMREITLSGCRDIEGRPLSNCSEGQLVVVNSLYALTPGTLITTASSCT
ncbi:MAG: hypothetical protein D6719_12915 [Candidatus Dadabacteria bacterium]|nr:MAG: hypothetical protein D6719_12915 [Candidatus Dadabacteria bacterium]